MEKFTLKDFIAYNNPCFNCKEKIGLSIVTNTITDHKIISHAPLRPLVTVDGTLVDLEITYSKTLQLFIEHKSNKITTSDSAKFASYLQNHKLFLNSACYNCNTNVESFFLEFDLKRGYLKPTSISFEHLVMTDSNNIYNVDSQVFGNTTNIKVISKFGTHDVVTVKTPLLLLGKFKNKEKWLSKLKTYLLFS